MRAVREVPLDWTAVSDTASPPLTIVEIQRRVGAELDRIGSVIDELGARFAEAGEELALIGCRKGEWQVEITTYRSETCDPSSRKPDVDFGDSLEGDLGRRDFSVNSMAVRVPGREFVDPSGGVLDLAARVLRTPGTPEDSFSDDPLRMMRAARFAAQLG